MKAIPEFPGFVAVGVVGPWEDTEADELDVDVCVLEEVVVDVVDVVEVELDDIAEEVLVVEGVVVVHEDAEIYKHQDLQHIHVYVMTFTTSLFKVLIEIITFKLKKKQHRNNN